MHLLEHPQNRRPKSVIVSSAVAAAIHGMKSRRDDSLAANEGRTVLKSSTWPYRSMKRRQIFPSSSSSRLFTREQCVRTASTNDELRCSAARRCYDRAPDSNWSSSSAVLESLLLANFPIIGSSRIDGMGFVRGDHKPMFDTI